jgi:hypothetical protein
MLPGPNPDTYELKDATLNGVRGAGCAYTEFNQQEKQICGVFVKAPDESEDLTQILHKGEVDFRGVHYDPFSSRKIQSEEVCLPVNIQFVTRRGEEERAIFEATG